MGEECLPTLQIWYIGHGFICNDISVKLDDNTWHYQTGHIADVNFTDHKFFLCLYWQK